MRVESYESSSNAIVSKHIVARTDKPLTATDYAPISAYFEFYPSKLEYIREKPKYHTKYLKWRYIKIAQIIEHIWPQYAVCRTKYQFGCHFLGTSLPVDKKPLSNFFENTYFSLLFIVLIIIIVVMNFLSCIKSYLCR
jgi:hypothetical protein